METLADVVSLVSDIFLVSLGVYVIAVILKVYSLYRTLGFSRTIITPFLLVGAAFAFSGVTELLGVFVGEIGSIAHSLTMLATAVFLVFGLSSYHKMLMKAEVSKRLSKISSKT